MNKAIHERTAARKARPFLFASFPIKNKHENARKNQWTFIDSWRGRHLEFGSSRGRDNNWHLSILRVLAKKWTLSTKKSRPRNKRVSLRATSQGAKIFNPTYSEIVSRAELGPSNGQASRDRNYHQSHSILHRYFGVDFTFPFEKRDHHDKTPRRSTGKISGHDSLPLRMSSKMDPFTMGARMKWGPGQAVKSRLRDLARHGIRFQ